MQLWGQKIQTSRNINTELKSDSGSSDSDLHDKELMAKVEKSGSDSE